MVVGGSENAEVVGGSDGGTVLRGREADGGAVGGQGGLVNVVASASTSEETLVANDGVDIGGRTLEQIKECPAVEVGLLEVQVELSTSTSGGWEEVEETLKLETLCERVADLKLGVEDVGGVPGLGQGQACAGVEH